MITNFKIFETVEDKRYWLIRCDYPYLEISLYKLNATKYVLDWALKVSEFVAKKKYKNIYIAPFGKRPEWDAFNITGREDFKKYDFQGRLEITPEDIENWKIKKQSEKYNL
jgi:hypothetical protein